MVAHKINLESEHWQFQASSADLQHVLQRFPAVPSRDAEEVPFNEKLWRNRPENLDKRLRIRCVSRRET